MRITIIGPRNTGKTLISKHLSKNYNLEYFEANFLFDKSLQEYEHNEKEILIKQAYDTANSIIDEVLKTKELVFDVGSALLDYDYIAKNKEHVKKIKENSILIGVLAHEEENKNLEILAKRELNSQRPCGINLDEIMDVFELKYSHLIPNMKKYCDFVVYYNQEDVDEICKEIIKFVYNN